MAWNGESDDIICKCCSLKLDEGCNLTMKVTTLYVNVVA